MPNPRRSSACDCTCVLTRIDHCLVTLSCLPCAFCFVPAYAKFVISDALSQALCNLSLAFLADFTLSDTTALTRFIAFSRKLNSTFCLDRKTSVHMFSVLHAQQFYTAGIPIPLLEAYLLPMANNLTRNERLSQEQNGRELRGPDSYACAFSAE